MYKEDEITIDNYCTSMIYVDKFSSRQQDCSSSCVNSALYTWAEQVIDLVTKC